MLGPYLSYVTVEDIDSSPKEKVREGGGGIKKHKERINLQIANNKILICCSVGLFSSHSFLAL